MAALLLSEPLPLRSARMLGDYADDVWLPEILGDFSNSPFPLYRLDDSRFFVCDHSAHISKVFIDRQQAADWAMVLESDGAGHNWTEIWFAAPVDLTAEVSACGTGREDDDTGQLITSPADAARRVMQIAGRTEDYSQLRAECSGLNLGIAVRLAEPLSIKVHIDAILGSVGGISCPGMARLYPSAAEPLPILDLDWHDVTLDAGDITAASTDVADVLRLAYDLSDASGRALHYIELSASPRRYGGLAKEVLYPYLRTPSNAEAVGRPVLQRLAGERWNVPFTVMRNKIRPGQWVRLVAHPNWPLPGADPVIMVLQAEIEEDSDSIRATGETLIGDKPTVTVTAHSVALPDTIEAGLDVTVRDGIATFTFLDKEKRPIAGARVSLDGAAPRTTDAQGKVSFPVNPGHTYELAFEAPGFTPFTVQVPL